MREVNTMATDAARNVSISDREWKEVGEIAEAIERSRSWVITKLISQAHGAIFKAAANANEPPYVDGTSLEELGLLGGTMTPKTRV